MSQLVTISQQLPPNLNQQPPRIPRWILYRSAAYLGGQGITFGDPIVPHAAKIHQKGSLNVDVMLTPEVDLIDNKLDCLADQRFNHLFIGPRLEMMENPPAMMKTLVGKLAPGGHLMIAQKLNNKQARFYWDSQGVASMVADSGKWRAKATYERDGWLLQIYKKLYGKKGIDPATAVSAKKRACICRYGALGDMIMITPLIHQLADDGYEVTMNISPYAMPIIEHNPHVHNLVIQEREMIPNQELGPYWDEWKKDYERYINLSESLEGRYLKVEGRRDFYTTKEWRIKTGEHNYYDATMRFGGYPDAVGRRGELFFTNAEERNCQKALAQFRNKFLILWAMNGSSHHKIYPAMELVIEDFLLRHDNVHIVLVGDGVTKLNYQHMRLHSKIGEWVVRDSLCAAKYANLVIGPETMMTNAAGSLGTPTITLLSHSTHEALCKHWGENDYCLAPEGIACYPCFQLHYTKESCPIQRMENVQTKEVIAEAPACAMSGIRPERLLARMEEVYGKFKAKSDIIIADGSVG
jgi:ADP-heptose:LPS heptosyltransferase